MSKDKLRAMIGWYEPIIVKRGSELIADIKEVGFWWVIKNKLKHWWFRLTEFIEWDVTIGGGVFFTTRNQEVAELLSRLVKVENKLDKLLKGVRK